MENQTNSAAEKPAVVVDIDENALYVHWIDVTSADPEEATRQIAAKFEKYLEVIYG